MNYIQNHHFYINLKKREEKKKLCEIELKKIGISNPNRFNAIENKIGLIGCVLSHIKCIEIAKKQKWNYVFIFEDDVLFIDNEKVKLMINKYIDYDYDVLYIGSKVINNRYSIINNDLIQIKKAHCTHAYIIKEHYYDKILNNLYEGLEKKKKYPNNHDYNIDVYYQNLQEQDKWLCFNPILATKRNGYSDNFNELRYFEDIIPIIPIKNNNLPYISILTPTFNRKMFLEMMIYNIKNFNYPKEKIEWCILDSYGLNGKISDKYLNDSEIINIEKELRINVSYTYLNKSMSIGSKRNWLCKNAKYNILINMDDDDIYLNSYLEHSVNRLLSFNYDCVGSKDMIFIFPYLNYHITEHQCVNNFTLINEATLCMTRNFWINNKYKDTSLNEGKYLFTDIENFNISYTNIFQSMICVCWKGNTIPKHSFHNQNKRNIQLQGAYLHILKKIFNNYNMEEQNNNLSTPNESSENIVDSKQNTTNINTIDINVDFLKQLRQLIEVTNDRIQWKTSELLPVGILIKQLDDLLENK